MATIIPRKRIIGVLMLSICAIIWGFAFVAQSNATSTLSAASFSGLRFVFSFAGLFIVYLIYDAINKKRGHYTIPWNLQTILGGAICGIALYFAMLCQQLGIAHTTVGKTSFITTLYIVIVPIVGIAARQKPNAFSAPAILIAVLGFFFMCITEKFNVTVGDALVLMCAAMYSMQILFISIYAKCCDPVRLTLVQFGSSAIIGIIGMAIAGFPSGIAIKETIFEILYLGILSGTIGFTMQTAGQKHVSPTVATLIMSMESVVGLIGGIIFLHQIPSPREILGCLLVLVAVVLAQFETHKTFLESKKNKYFLQ